MLWTTDKAHYKQGLIEVTIRWLKETLQESPPTTDPFHLAFEIADAHNCLTSIVDQKSPHWRVFGDERRQPVLEAYETDRNALDRPHRTRTAWEIRSRNELRTRIRRAFLTALCNRRIATVANKQSRDAPIPEAESVGKACLYYFGKESTLDKKLWGWRKATIIGVQKDLYALRTQNGRIIMREPRLVKLDEGTLQRESASSVEA